MKILFATMPFDGHFNPATAIAAHLRECGHDVRWYAGPSYQRKLADLGIPSFPFRRAQEVNGENIAERYPERARLKGPKLLAFDGEMIFAAPAEGHYRDIVDIHTEFGFEAIFCDPAFYAAKPLGQTLSVPVYALGIWPMMAPSRDVPPPFFGLRPARTPVGRLAHRGVRVLLHSTMKPGVRRYNALLESVGSEPIRVGQWLDLVERCARICFQSGTPGLDYSRSDPPSNVEYVGPLLPHAKAVATPYEHEDRLRGHPSKVVVVSQGTVDNVDPGKLIVPALDALKDTPYVVVVTTGGRHTAELRERYPGPNVLIEDFVDFNMLFSRADAFISNGGSGSVLLALRHGVPILTAGSTEGKNDINARLGYLKLGVDLRTQRPSSKRIADGLRRLLADGEIRDNVARLRRDFDSYDAFEIIERRLAEDAARTLNSAAG